MAIEQPLLTAMVNRRRGLLVLCHYKTVIYRLQDHSASVAVWAHSAATALASVCLGPSAVASGRTGSSASSETLATRRRVSS